MTNTCIKTFAAASLAAVAIAGFAAWSSQKSEAAQTTSKTPASSTAAPATSSAMADLKVNNAGPVCEGVRTANAAVYMIDTVLMPPGQ